MTPKPKIPPDWKPAIQAILLGSRGGISQAEVANALGTFLGCTISDSRIRQIMYGYDKIDGKVQKRTLANPTQGESND